MVAPHNSQGDYEQTHHGRKGHTGATSPAGLRLSHGDGSSWEKGLIYVFKKAD